MQVVYTDCLYSEYRPFSKKYEDEKEGVKFREKTPGKRAPVQNPRGGCLLGGWAHVTQLTGRS